MPEEFDIHPNTPQEEFDAEGFKKGEKKAFKWIFDKLYKQLVYFAQSLGVSQMDAEDIVASAFYKLFNHKEDKESYTHIRRWMFFIVKNACIDKYREKLKSRRENIVIGYLAEDVDEGAEQEMLRTAILNSLAEQIEKLPPQRKKILKLYFFGGKNTAEIADELSLSTQTVRNQKVSALETLKTVLPHPKWFLPLVTGLVTAACCYIIRFL